MMNLDLCVCVCVRGETGNKERQADDGEDDESGSCNRQKHYQTAAYWQPAGCS